MQIVYMCHMHSCVFNRHRKYTSERYEHLCKPEGNTKSGLIEIFSLAFVILLSKPCYVIKVCGKREMILVIDIFQEISL